MALVSLGRKPEALDKLANVMDIYSKNKKDYLGDAALSRLLRDFKYMSATKEKSPNWRKVKFKENCFVVDPNGFGDFKTVAEALEVKFKSAKQVKGSRLHFELHEK